MVIFFLGSASDLNLFFINNRQVLHPIADSININIKVWNMYFRDLIPRLVEEGDDGNCGSAAVCDTMCLQVCFSTNLFIFIEDFIQSDYQMEAFG